MIGYCVRHQRAIRVHALRKHGINPAKASLLGRMVWLIGDWRAGLLKYFKYRRFGLLDVTPVGATYTEWIKV